MQKEILAAMTAASSDVNMMTIDRIEALAMGHGMVNLAAYAIANVIIDAVSGGADIKIKNANVRAIPLEDVTKKAIDAARRCGALPANAALLSATMLYFAGSGARSGVALGNRKVGALARMIAGADRCGVAVMPTHKAGNKISGFPAVQAIYEAMQRGELTEVKGNKRPAGVGNIIFGHSALGEEHAFPELARNAARIGTQAMLEAMSGAAMLVDPVMAAIFGAAATLEIIHPDAWTCTAEGGPSDTCHNAGEAAAKAAGLPGKLHLHLTGEEFDTATIVGDLGLILKDVGGVTIPGMQVFRDLLSVFKEPASPFRPITTPIGHISAEAMLAMKALLAWDMDYERVARAMIEIENTRLDPEMALIALNTTARKAEEVHRGEVTSLLIKATDPARTKGLYRRAKKAYDDLSAGKDLAEVVRGFDVERKEKVEKNASDKLSLMFGKRISVEILKIAALRHKGVNWDRYWVLDMDVDVKVSVDGETTIIEGLSHKALPDAVLYPDKNPKMIGLMLPACLPVNELSLSGHTIINVTVPAAVAAAMGKASPMEAAKIAEEAAFITAGFPGTKARATDVASRAVLISEAFDKN
jgi:hypothetical protein